MLDLQMLTLRIYSTWGDPHYVGMAGCDFFDADGRPVLFTNAKVRSICLAVHILVSLFEYTRLDYGIMFLIWARNKVDIKRTLRTAHIVRVAGVA